MHEGQTCPRDHCGGRLLARVVIGEEGQVRELWCHLCSRTWVVKIETAYRPVIRFRPEVEAALTVKADGFFQSLSGRALAGLDRTEDIVLPRTVREALGDFLPLTDQLPPASPRDNT